MIYRVHLNSKESGLLRTLYYLNVMLSKHRSSRKIYSKIPPRSLGLSIPLDETIFQDKKCCEYIHHWGDALEVTANDTIFYPAIFGMQNDVDNRILEILFGIPDYKCKVWCVEK